MYAMCSLNARTVPAPHHCKRVSSRFLISREALLQKAKGQTAGSSCLKQVNQACHCKGRGCLAIPAAGVPTRHEGRPSNAPTNDQCSTHARTHAHTHTRLSVRCCFWQSSCMQSSCMHRALHRAQSQHTSNVALGCLFSWWSFSCCSLLCTHERPVNQSQDVLQAFHQRPLYTLEYKVALHMRGCARLLLSSITGLQDETE
jgi:hypothetical protein